MEYILGVIFKATAVWCMVEYFIGIGEAIIFHDEPYEEHKKHINIAGVLTFVVIIEAIIYNQAFLV